MNSSYISTDLIFFEVVCWSCFVSLNQGWGEVFKKNLFKEDWFWEDDSLEIDLYKKIFKNMEKEKILGRKRRGKKHGNY